MGTFGDIGVAGAFVAYSLELPWIDNKRGISCIPCSTYSLRQDYYHKGDYPCWEICDVPDRDEIKMHIGNTVADIEGCVAMGTGLGRIYQKWAVTSSGIAFRKFMTAMEVYDSATIVVFNK